MFLVTFDLTLHPWPQYSVDLMMQITLQEKKRDYSLKSPGLKLLSSRHSTSTLGRSEKSHPTSLATTPSTPTFPHISEEVGDMDSSCGATPPTPSTPITPPGHDTSDQSVFASVMLPSASDTCKFRSIILIPTSRTNDIF